MGIAEVIILIVGAILFTISFFIPERTVNTKENKEREEEIVKEALAAEMAKYKYQMEEAARDSIENTKDTSERYMERITNEKMMAISEYSDTVMEQIHKNHEEAMFLYDMLNNKHTQIKNTAAELNQLTKTTRQAGLELQEKVQAKPTSPIEEKPAVKEEKKELQFEPIQPQRVELPKTQKKTATKEKNSTKTQKAKGTNNTVEVRFDSDNGANNSNDRILSLHKAGKSNMAIAKELGLGIGEVKLVIDLFEGI